MPMPNMETNVTKLLNMMGTGLEALDPDLTPSEVRARVVASNLRGLVQVLLLGDDPESPVKVDQKQVCLGLLATADWLDPDGGDYFAE